MATSKIKTIESIKEYNGQNGTVFYHNLEMENGDKINIGKKKAMMVGWEIDYEILEFGQQEYQKARAIKKEFVPQKKDDTYVKGIEVGHAVNNAVNMLCGGLVFEDVDEKLNNDNKIYLYVKPNDFKQEFNKSKGGNGSFALSYAKDLVVADKIKLDDILKTADKFKAWLDGTN